MPPARSREATPRLTACRAHPVSGSTSPGMQAPTCSMCAQPPTRADRAVRDVDGGREDACPAPPRRRRDVRDDASGVVEDEGGGLRAADVDAEPHPATSPRSTASRARATAGDPPKVSMSAPPRGHPQSTSSDVVPRSAQPVGGRMRGVAGTDGAPDDRDPGPRRHVALRDRRPERSRAPGDVADGEVRGALDLHHRERATGRQPPPGPLADPERAGHDLVAQWRGGDVGADAVGRHPLGRLVREGAHPAGSLGDPLPGQPARPHGGHDGGVHLGVPLLRRCASRGRAGRRRRRGRARRPRGCRCRRSRRPCRGRR